MARRMGYRKTSGNLEESQATQTDLEKPMKIQVRFYDLLISKSHILFPQHGEQKSKTPAPDFVHMESIEIDSDDAEMVTGNKSDHKQLAQGDTGDEDNVEVVFDEG
jgi:hypothetical protein